MRKKLALTLVLLLLFILSGCMQFSSNYRIFNDGTYQSELEILIPTEIYNNDTYHIEDYRDEILSIFSDNASILEEVTVIDEVEYQRIQIQQDRQLPSDNNVEITIEDDEILFVQTLNYTENFLVDFDVFGLGDDYKEVLASYGFSIMERIQMPGDIISCNAGIINGDILVVDLIEEDVSKIIVRSTIDNSVSSLLVIFISVLVLLIALILLYISYNQKKRKKKASEEKPIMQIDNIEKIEEEKNKNDILDTLALEEKEDNRDFPY